LEEQLNIKEARVLLLESSEKLLIYVKPKACPNTMAKRFVRSKPKNATK
jgi:hypothetical protein